MENKVVQLLLEKDTASSRFQLSYLEEEELNRQISLITDEEWKRIIHFIKEDIFIFLINRLDEDNKKIFINRVLQEFVNNTDDMNMAFKYILL